MTFNDDELERAFGKPRTDRTTATTTGAVDVAKDFLQRMKGARTEAQLDAIKPEYDALPHEVRRLIDGAVDFMLEEFDDNGALRDPAGEYAEESPVGLAKYRIAKVRVDILKRRLSPEQMNRAIDVSLLIGEDITTSTTGNPSDRTARAFAQCSDDEKTMALAIVDCVTHEFFVKHARAAASTTRATPSDAEPRT